MRNTKALVASAASVGLLALAAMSGVAVAATDTNTTSNTTLVGVGSDTSQDVMSGLSLVIKDSSSNPLISNYVATPVGSTITTKSNNSNCTFTRPVNSGAGRDALSAAMRGASYGVVTAGSGATSPNMTGCVDFARSSSSGNPTVSPGVGTMTYIPFATDAVTYATLATSAVPHSLQKADLIAIYTANGTPGSAACTFQPLLPALGSGTRSFFVKTVLGLSDVPIGATGGPGTCVKDTDASGTAIQEHDGRFVTNGSQLVPISVAQYIAQAGGVISDIRGRTSLGSIDDQNNGVVKSGLQLSTSFGFTRPIYNVVPTSGLVAGSTLDNVFDGPSSAVCSNATTINNYGFAVNSNCGSTTLKNTN